MNRTKQARELLYRLSHLMPTVHQERTFQAFLLALLMPYKSSVPEHNPLKSNSSISRFLNHYGWSTRTLVRAVRKVLTDWLFAASKVGRNPYLKVIIDLTCIEKRGRFEGLGDWVNAMHAQVGLHLVMVYIELIACAYPGTSVSGKAKAVLHP